MPNNLPRTLPAGTVVFVPDKDGTYAKTDGDMYELAHPECATLQRYTRHVLTSPVHILDEGMVEAVRDVDEYDEGLIHGSGLGEYYEPIQKRFRAAFAHVLTPQETGKDETCREKIESLRDATCYPATARESLTLERITILADAIDAQQKSIAALRAEVKEGRNGR